MSGSEIQQAIGVRQGCLLSLTLFNIIFLERILLGALADYTGIDSISGRAPTRQRFADKTDGLAEGKAKFQELEPLVDQALISNAKKIGGRPW